MWVLAHVATLDWPVTVALIIATMKGSLVASIFMHLSHEKKWIYGALILTVAVCATAPVESVACANTK